MIDLNPVPNRLTRPDTIDDDADSFFGKLPQWGADLLAIYAGVGANQAGGAFAIPYILDSVTTDGDPGAGKLRFDNATQNTATTLRLDLTGSGVGDVTGILDRFDASTSSIKGSIRLVKQGDLSKWAVYDVTARAAPSGYRNISVTPIAASSANPFTAGDTVVLVFTRNGDKGDIGPANTMPTMRVRDQKATNTGPQTGTTATFVTRTLNTTVYSTIAGAALASNQITLPAGSYDVYVRAPAVGGKHQASLWNVTANGHWIVGSSAGNSPTADDTSTDSIIVGRVVLAAAAVFEVRHWHQVGGKNMGTPVNSGQAECYTEAVFTKVA
jgi:hypothetical protein